MMEPNICPRQKSTLSILLFIILTLLSCSVDDRNQGPYQGTYFMPPPDPETLVLYDLADPPTLDPARTWGFFDGRLIGLVFSNLVRFDAKAKIVPDLAVKWDFRRWENLYIYTESAGEILFRKSGNSRSVVYSFERIQEQSHWITERFSMWRQ